MLILNESKTYTLTEDIDVSGTAIVVAADNVILDLNGHTVFYNPGGNTRRYGIAIPMNYIDKNWFPDVPDAAFVGAKNFKVINGNIVQNGEGDNCHGIFGYGVNNCDLSDLKITIDGDDTDGILLYYGSSHQVHDNTINNNSTVVTDRHAGRESIGLLMDQGNSNIFNNRIFGGPQYGIRVIQYDENNDKEILIYQNYISHNATVANPYAIGIYARKVKCYNNVIKPKNGRGIHVSLVDTVEVNNNEITVREKANAEFDPGWCHGIKLEDCSNTKIYENTVTAIGGNLGFGYAYALDITDQGGIDSENEIYHNRFSALTQNSDYHAAALHLVGVLAGSKMNLYRNQFQSNNFIVRVGWDSANDLTLDSNQFVKAGSVNFHTIHFETGDLPSENLIFLNTKLGSGVNLFNISYRPIGANFNYGIATNIKIYAIDGEETPLEGVSVSIYDKDEELIKSGETDENGYVVLSPTVITVSKPIIKNRHFPGTLVLEKAGYQTVNTALSTSTPKYITMEEI